MHFPLITTALLSLASGGPWLAAAHVSGGDIDRGAAAPSSPERKLWNSHNNSNPPFVVNPEGYSCYDLVNPCDGNDKTWLPSSRSPRHYLLCNTEYRQQNGYGQKKHRTCHEESHQTCKQHSHEHDGQPEPPGANVFCPSTWYCQHACTCDEYKEDPELCPTAPDLQCADPGGEIPAMKSRQECCPCCNPEVCEHAFGTSNSSTISNYNAFQLVKNLDCDAEYYDRFNGMLVDPDRLLKQNNFCGYVPNGTLTGTDNNGTSFESCCQSLFGGNMTGNMTRFLYEDEVAVDILSPARHRSSGLEGLRKKRESNHKAQEGRIENDWGVSAEDVDDADKWD